MKFIIDSKCSLNHRCEQTVNVKQCGGGGAVTSLQEGPRFGFCSRRLIAVWMLSPYLRAFPLAVPPSSHPPRQAAEVLGLSLPLPLPEVLASELELVPGRGAVMAHSS